MARLRDFPAAVQTAGPFTFVKRLWCQIQEDDILTLAAAMAFSWIFALFPFFIFVVTLAPYLPLTTRTEVGSRIEDIIDRWLPDDAAVTVQDNVNQVLAEPRGGLLSVSIILAIWVASSGVAMTMTALNRCYGVESHRTFFLERLIAIGLTIATAILILMVFILLPIGTLVTNLTVQWLRDHRGEEISPVIRIGWDVIRWLVALFCLVLVVATFYYFGASRVRHNFRLFSPGGLFTIVVWIGLALAFGFYIDRFARYDQMYGALGGVVILMMLFYLNALVLLVGAEINSEVDFTLRGEPEGASDPEAGPPILSPAEEPAKDETKAWRRGPQA